ncbi:MAG: hypothetical protein J2P25_17805 [Nocardiopsaceae bacterium]|nr:hypothetical protein [Nocardiopsaceae bacterium]
MQVAEDGARLRDGPHELRDGGFLLADVPRAQRPLAEPGRDKAKQGGE